MADGWGGASAGVRGAGPPQQSREAPRPAPAPLTFSGPRLHGHAHAVHRLQDGLGALGQLLLRSGGEGGGGGGRMEGGSESPGREGLEREQLLRETCAVRAAWTAHAHVL
jgi:hypothetical protein